MMMIEMVKAKGELLSILIYLILASFALILYAENKMTVSPECWFCDLNDGFSMLQKTLPKDGMIKFLLRIHFARFHMEAVDAKR